MNSNFQKGQKVRTPDGQGSIEEIIGEKVVVKLDSGETKDFAIDQVEDDADQG